MMIKQRKNAHRRVKSVLSLLFFFTLLAACSRQPSYPAPPITGTNVSVDVASLRQEAPQFYTYRYRGKNISFFLLKIRDKVNSFLDACTSCYPQKMGYRCEDGSVTCRYCDMRFSIFRLEKGLGSCYPVKIDGRTENGKYLIPIATLEAAADKF